MKLKEVIEDFREFGFTESEVRKALGAGDSSFNAYEGLKILLELKWADMNQEMPADLLVDLKPVYDRLMGLKMKSRTTVASKKKERRARAQASARIVQRMMKDRKQENLAKFIEYTEEELEKQLKDKSPEEIAEIRARMGQIADLFGGGKS